MSTRAAALTCRRWSNARGAGMPPRIGETYVEDPFKRAKEKPHQGGYAHTTLEEWAEYDRAMAEWQTRRRES
jgi:hypothetical protein